MGIWSWFAGSNVKRMLSAPDVINLSRSFSYDSSEVAVAFRRVAERRYGAAAISGISIDTYKLTFVDAPLSFMSVKTGIASEEQGLVGGVRISLKDGGEINCNIDGENSNIMAVFSAKYKNEAEAFLDEISEKLGSDSIYKGQAITTYRGFMDLSGIAFDKVVYDSEVWQELNEHIWALIRKPDECAKIGVTLPRKVLLQGQFGSGKTLAISLTAKIATDCGWTFVYMPTTSLQNPLAISGAIGFTKRYASAVLAIEDIDYEQREENPFTLKSALDAIDGAMTKGMQILVIMTTNHPERISPAMQRPGRIDKIIRLEALGPEDTKRLIKISVGELAFDSIIDWTKVADACKDYPPAFIQGVAKNAALKMIGSSDTVHITENMLIEAAKDLREQFEACSKDPGQYL